MVAQFLPEGGGYANFLHGKVVDMFYFPIITDAHFPSWMPIWGGESFEFFRPVFNFAHNFVSFFPRLFVPSRPKNQIGQAFYE
jgi:signal peptidase II